MGGVVGGGGSSFSLQPVTRIDCLRFISGRHDSSSDASREHLIFFVLF